MIDASGQRQSFLSSISGILTKLCIAELDIISYDSLILEYEECRHTITFKNLCGDCGIDASELKNVISTSKSSKSVISMKPSFPQLTITREEASRYDIEERNHFLRKRKLHLLVDLDQTLVHTTNTKNHYPYSSDIVSYQLNTPTLQTFYTKLRPGVKEFLTNLQSLYQFHIVTFGDRPYANSIAKLIDPDGKLFSHRILSRDECPSLTDKTANLNSLFPSGDSLVCIVDDREDVWNYASNLVRVKPYTWFKDVGDINSIHLSSLNNNSQEKRQRGEKRKFYTEKDGSSIELKKHNNFNEVVDYDFYLRQLEIILKRIHTIFYLAYDKWMQDKCEIMPDLKKLMPNIRQQILKSVSLCFSNLMPQDYPREKHPATIMAQMMGAIVTQDLQFDRNGIIRTTHVIAGKQTMKVYQALQHNIKVVTPEWLIDCYEQWEKKLEENYILTPEYNVRESRLFTEEIPRVSNKRRYCDTQEDVSLGEQSFLNQPNNKNPSNSIPLENLFDQSNLNKSIDTHCDMEKDTNNIYTKDVDDFNETHLRSSKRQCTRTIIESVTECINDNDDGFDSDSSSICKLHDLVLDKKDGYSSDEESLSDDDTPRGWKKDQRQKRRYL